MSDMFDEPILFGVWLSETRWLQTKSFGTDPGALPYEGGLKGDFVTWNHSELCTELGEMMNEFPGHKTWVTDRTLINREQFIGEAVDALHFFANILAAVDCTDGELNKAYLAKMQKNRERMESKVYDGVSSKCGICHRDLNDAGVECTLELCASLVG